MCCADSEESYEFILAASKKKKKNRLVPQVLIKLISDNVKKKARGLLFRVFSKPLYELHKAETNLIRLKYIH